MARDKALTDIGMSEASNRLMLALLCVGTEQGASIERKVDILDRFGLPDAEIARVCGCAEQSVKNARQSLKKRSPKVGSRRDPEDGARAASPRKRPPAWWG